MKNLYGRACHPAVEMTAMERVQVVMRMVRIFTEVGGFGKSNPTKVLRRN